MGIPRTTRPTPPAERAVVGSTEGLFGSSPPVSPLGRSVVMQILTRGMVTPSRRPFVSAGLVSWQSLLSQRRR